MRANAERVQYEIKVRQNHAYAGATKALGVPATCHEEAQRSALEVPVNSTITRFIYDLRSSVCKSAFLKAAGVDY
ncbi:hypothetical protein FQK07_14885 [Synechococcus sp. BSF8S]|uniref:hypothetical protein n=1 Tax=Synechococcales TaxID=1890424 RepID=UPI0016273109|nr:MULTISPECIES: hypothetical protein [unclassified Synechococcus]MBC1262509.1 hypothetical protein [Synechococcus sp. BSF8S]MBC1263668.1 hypothetical protein [Synechococcus sp. BSA11S]